MISVFTPSHDTTYLDEACASMLRQTYEDWEWIVLLNAGATWEAPSDPRIRVVSESTKVRGVGDAKRRACALAGGEILLELDHDDILGEEALEQVAKAFDENPEVVFVYSNFAQINADGSRNIDKFNLDMGWQYRETIVNDLPVLECIAMPLNPHAVSFIWFAPNHLRAFRKDTYDAIGGYNETLEVLDDLDIICRLYQQGEFHHLDECLYLQRVHPDNTQARPDLNERIQVETVAIYDQQVQANALAWAKREGLHCIDLGSAHNKPEGYIGIDLYEAPGVDLVCDVTKGLPFEDNSVGVIRAVDFLEHIPDKIALFNEFYRVLCHGGMLLSLTPSTDGRGAFQDPTHVSFYNENSFWYFTSRNFANYVPEIEARFQVSRLLTMFPDAWHEANNISYVNANLVAVKDGPRIAGELNI